MPVETFTLKHRLWPACVEHLERVGMTQWVLDENLQPKPDIYFLGMVEGDTVVGHITLLLQDIVCPETAWSSHLDRTLRLPDGEPLRETFVQTFAVDEAYRRRGYGLALQKAALALTRELGCYQMRSWASLDRPANYALKLSLGFAVHPAIYETSGGQQISGVYFIKTV